MSDYVYLDNAATSFPKPPEIVRFMCDFYSSHGVNPGRTGFDLALEAEDTVLETRQALTDFFGGTDRNRLVFSLNVTDALNMLIGSVLGPGDHAITTCLEHNSVLRPLVHLQASDGVTLTVVPPAADGVVSGARVARAIRPGTALVVAGAVVFALGEGRPQRRLRGRCRCRVAGGVLRQRQRRLQGQYIRLISTNTSGQ